MKKTLQKLVVTALTTNLLLVAIPTTAVWAQDGEESTEEVAETATEEEASEEETTEETTEEEVATEGHALKDVLVEATAENLALLDAFADYQKVIEQFSIQDLNVSDVVGSSFDEVVDNFDGQVEPEVFDLSENEKYLSYTYEIDEISSVTEENKAAELILYFSDDTLLYVGIATLDMELYPEDVLSEEEIETWIADQVDIQTVADRQTRIMGLSEMVFDGIPYHMVFLPTITAENEVFGDFMIISEGAVFDSYPLGIEEAIESPQTTMLSLFSDFFGFGAETEETPVEEEPAEEETTEESAE